MVCVTEDPDGSVLDVGRRTRIIPTALRRAMKIRDRGCRFPSCTNTRYTHGHHIRHWAHGGSTCLENLITLCSAHHRLVHEGDITMGSRNGQPIFLRPDGEVIEARPTCVDPGPGALVERHQRQGLDIGPETSMPYWGGERLDLGMAVDGLLWLDGLTFSGLPEAS